MRRYLADCGAYAFSCGHRMFFEDQVQVQDQDIWLDIIDVLQSNIKRELKDPDFKPESVYLETTT